MGNKYPIWYRRLLYSYPIHDEDAEWMFEIWSKCETPMSAIRKIADRCKWISNDMEGRFEIHTGYVPEHFVMDKSAVEYKVVFVPADYGRVDYVRYLEFFRDNEEPFFLYVVDRLSLKREKDLFLLWKRCMEDGPGRGLRVLLGFAG
jgi:hypothetical protein